MEKLLYKVMLLEDEIKSYDCALCQKSFLDSEDIENHLKLHERGKNETL